jgi:hypothetical protein
MRKVQVFLREDQKAALKSIGARTGQKQSDLIRKSVDLPIDKTKHEDVRWREATRAAAGMWRDYADIERRTDELRASIKRRFPSVYKQG